MGDKSYEYDRGGRITVYPSLSDPSQRKTPLLKKLIDRFLRTDSGSIRRKNGSAQK